MGWRPSQPIPTVKTFVALLRGINVGGNNQIPMAGLCSLCSGIGWMEVRNYIQSGNLVFSARDTSTVVLEKQLEQAIHKQFNLTIPVIVRAGAKWPAYVKNNPFPAASKKEPNLVMLGLSKAPPKPDAAKLLRERATNGERIEQVGDALWIHFRNGVAGSKLSPALFDRLVASPVTLRNWRTVLTLREMTEKQPHAKGAKGAKKYL